MLIIKLFQDDFLVIVDFHPANIKLLQQTNRMKYVVVYEV